MKMASTDGVDREMLIQEEPKKQHGRCRVDLGSLVRDVVLVLAAALTTVVIAGAMAPHYVDPMMDKVFSRASEEMSMNMNPMYNVKALLNTDIPGMARNLLSIVNRMDQTYNQNNPPPQGIAEVMMMSMYARPFLTQAESMTVPRDTGGQTSASLFGMMDIGHMGSMDDSDFYNISTTCLNGISQYRENWDWTEFESQNTFEVWQGHQGRRLQEQEVDWSGGAPEMSPEQRAWMEAQLNQARADPANPANHGSWYPGGSGGRSTSYGGSWATRSVLYDPLNGLPSVAS